MARALGVTGSFAAALVVLWTAGATGCGGSGHPGSPAGPPGTSGPSGSTGPSASSGDPGSGASTPAGGGSSGGTSGGSSPCGGLLASPDDGRMLRLESSQSCAAATTTSDGQLVVGFASRWATLTVYAPGGSSPEGTIPSVGGYVWGTSTGYAATVYDSRSPPFRYLRFFDRSGNVLATSADTVGDTAPDLHGGIVALAGRYGPVVTPLGSFLEWFDGSGRLVRAVPIEDDHATFLAVVPGTEDVLTVGTRGATARARWYDAAGNPLTSSFDLGPLFPSALALLVDGAVAIAEYGGWRGIVRDGAATMDSPPAWLAARPQTRVAIIRSGRGYAILATPLQIDQSAPRQVEILDAAGESCGSITLPPPTLDPGVTAYRGALTVGGDGTVLETDALHGASGSGQTRCAFRWWPELLR